LDTQFLNTTRMGAPNQTRRLYFIGDPRREAHARGQALYKIEPAEHELLKSIGSQSQPHDRSDSGRYKQQVKTSNPARRRVLRKEPRDAGIAREACIPRHCFRGIILTDEPGATEIPHRTLCSTVFRRQRWDQESTFDEVQDFYRRRNKLVHGDYPVEEYSNGTFVKLDEIERWSSLIRRAVVGFFVLALRGETKRERLITI